MNKNDENYLFVSINKIMDSLREQAVLLNENNLMIKQVVQVINAHILHYHKENEEDFGRNVLANLLSSWAEGKVLRR